MFSGRACSDQMVIALTPVTYSDFFQRMAVSQLFLSQIHNIQLPLAISVIDVCKTSFAPKLVIGRSSVRFLLNPTLFSTSDHAQLCSAGLEATEILTDALQLL